ncbi:hypothetical protein FE257_011517 [Aspergillus nanangensis]|uniref:Uncharacterized protein n=1 Tax=Aspergillus nanangensis TaxID=2582783 RepID=A0AAD4CHE3_ASPNN|nr:hypothetical protein FE257_011517 [Aspergillus nanangensis]
MDTINPPSGLPNKPTGFEEFYVDTPMTPDEHQEETTLYDVRRPITHSRVEDALLRFQKVRRFESERWDIFLKYLAYGGIDIGPHMFAGVDGHDLKNMDTEQIMMARTQTTIRPATSGLPVDFNKVVKGYLTSFFPYYFVIESEETVKLATVTIRSFLSYLLYHDVCPEYKDNVEEGRKSCDTAAEELWKNQLLTVNGPGDFNAACSTLFGGFLHDTYTQDNQWGNTLNLITRDVAHKVVKFGLAAAGSNEQVIQFHKLAGNGSCSAKRVDAIHGFEVTAVSRSGSAVSAFYQKHAPGLNPVGKLYGKAYCDPGKSAFDLPSDDHAKWEEGSVQQFEFFVEESLLQVCYPGMKVIAPVWELGCGVHFFEDVQTVYCSLYTPLPNDLLLGWQKPRGVVVKKIPDDQASTDDEGSEEKGTCE